MEKVSTLMLTSIGTLAVVAGLSFLLTYPLMWAINYAINPTLIAAVVGTAQIAFWKTYVLSFVTGWLFTAKTTSSSK